MEFQQIIGDIDKNLVFQLEKSINDVLLKLAGNYDATHIHDGLCGDAFIFTLLYPQNYYCTYAIPTISTTGKRIFINPKFAIKLNPIGLRFLMTHEALHGYFDHAGRIQGRDPKLWGLAVDFITNDIIMQDIKRKNKNAREMFNKYLGKYLTVNQLAEWISNNKLPSGFTEKELQPNELTQKLKPIATVEDCERKLTAEEIKNIEALSSLPSFFYADEDLKEEFRRPERLYDYLEELIRKNPEGRDKLGMGGTLDQHMQMEETPEETNQRFSDAINTVRKMGGKGAGAIPSGLETDLGELTKPRISFQDIIFMAVQKVKDGNIKNRYTEFRTRPMAVGMLLPKKVGIKANCAVLLDTSGSMGSDDKALGISQLQVLDNKATITVVPADAEIFWNDAVSISRAKAEDLMKIKTPGGGGTRFGAFFTDCEKQLKMKPDLYIMITDGYLDSSDVNSMKKPKVPVYWLITSTLDFQAPFGRVLRLN